jgi:hypothetical protein
MAESLSTALDRVLNERTENLNASNNEESGWFRVVVEEPVIYPSHTPWMRIIIGAICGGVVLGLWIVGIIGYRKGFSHRQ